MAAHPAAPILTLEHIGKHYPVNGTVTTVLADITLNAFRGEMVCIIGRSGCGKTTLLNILAGFIPPDTGQVHMDSRPVTSPGPDRCVVFQEDTLFPWLTVAENIAFGLKDRRRHNEIERFLQLVGLQDFRHYLPREISGGMKQRVALARVLILNPRVLLMDEPFAALDYHTRREMQDLLVWLWKELGHTIIFVTHDLDEAITLADTIVVMEAGRILERLPVPLERPRSPAGPDYLLFRKHLLSRYEGRPRQQSSMPDNSRQGHDKGPCHDKRRGS